MNYTKRLFLMVIFFVFLLPLCTDTAEKKKRKRSPDSSEQNRPSKRAKQEEPIVFVFGDDKTETKMQVSHADWNLIEKLGTIKDVVEDLGKKEEIPLSRVSPDTFSKVLNLLKSKLNIENLSEQQLVDLIHAFNYLAGPESDFKKLCQAYVTYIEKNDIKVENPFNHDIEHQIMPYMLKPVIPYLHFLIANNALANAYSSVAGQTPKIYEMAELEALQGIYAGNMDYLFSTIKMVREPGKLLCSPFLYKLTIHGNLGEKIETLIDEFSVSDSYVSPDGMLLTGYGEVTKKITIVDVMANKKYSVPCEDWDFAAAFKCNEELRLFLITKVNQSYQFHILKFDPKNDSSAVVWKKSQPSIVGTRRKCQNIFFNNEGTIGALYFGKGKKETPAEIAFIDLQEQKLIKKIDCNTLIKDRNYFPKVMVFGPFAASNIEVDMGAEMGASHFYDLYCNIFPNGETEIKWSYTNFYNQPINRETWQISADQKDQAFFESTAGYITGMTKNWRTAQGGLDSRTMPRQFASFIPWLTENADTRGIRWNSQRYKSQSFAVVNQEQGRLFMVNQKYNKIAEFSLGYPSVDKLLGDITLAKVSLLYQTYLSIKNGKGELLIHPQTRNEELFDSMYSDENLRKHVLPVFFPAKTIMRMKSIQSQ